MVESCGVSYVGVNDTVETIQRHHAPPPRAHRTILAGANFLPAKQNRAAPRGEHLANLGTSRHDHYHSSSTCFRTSHFEGEPHNTLRKARPILAGPKACCFQATTPLFLTIWRSTSIILLLPLHSGLASIQAMTMNSTYPGDWVCHQMIMSVLWLQLSLLNFTKC